MTETTKTTFTELEDGQTIWDVWDFNNNTWSEKLESKDIAKSPENEKTVCFTGHRPNRLFGYRKPEPYKRVMNTITAICDQYFCEENARTFVSGCAQGIDQLAFWAVERLKQLHPDAGIRNYVFVPCKGFGGNWPTDSMFGQDKLQKILETCDGFYMCQEEEYTGPECLFQRNRDMLEVSDICLACWNMDTDPLQTRGGTAGTIKEALSPEFETDTMLFDIPSNTIQWLNREE